MHPLALTGVGFPKSTLTKMTIIIEFDLDMQNFVNTRSSPGMNFSQQMGVSCELSASMPAASLSLPKKSKLQ